MATSQALPTVWLDALTAFEEDLRRRAVAEKTHRAYGIDTHQFAAWAGSLAGRTIPPGPQDPIKARWMGIFNGAGIHGTEELSSLGSAASHGCIRMAIPDVEALYDQVSIGTPVYIA